MATDIAEVAHMVQSMERPKTADANATRVEKENSDALRRLAEAGGKLTAEEDIVFQGTKLIFPERMTLFDGIMFLFEKLAEDERETEFSRTYDYRPYDGARATLQALKTIFGVVTSRGTPGMFPWSPDEPPEMITIPTGVKEREQVPWGGLAVPMLPGLTLYLGSRNHPEMGPLFHLRAVGPRKHRFHVEGIFRMVEHQLQTESLYRGKAFDGQAMPEFLDLSGVNPDQVIYSDEVIVQLEANVWSLLRYSRAMVEVGQNLKRAVLFEGPYGTGKTLGAYLTAKIAAENGWTFIYCRPGRDDLSQVMATARLYQPSVVFYEDVDTVAGTDPGAPDEVSKLLDIFDGIQAKGTAIVCVLTTNHVERIHKAMIRPGRLDAVIHIGELDASGVERMARATIPTELLSEDIDWVLVGKAMEGFLPAFAREAMDRSVRYNLMRGQGHASVIQTDDLVYAAEGLRPQLKLMEEAKERPSPDALSVAMTDAMATVVNEAQLVDSDGDPVRGGERLQVSANGSR